MFNVELTFIRLCNVFEQDEIKHLFDMLLYEYIDIYLITAFYSIM